MKKTLLSILFFSFLIMSLAGCSNHSENTQQNSDEPITSQRLSTNISTNENPTQPNNMINEIRIGAHEADGNIEEELASFSTKLSGKDTPRTRNIGITTSILNETIVKNGEIFSFCNIVGNPTADRGYEEADSFDADGKTVKTYGGRKLSS